MDESMIKADVFFFITTVAVVLLTLLLVVGLVYVLSILRTIKKISKTAQAGAESIVEGIKEAKTAVKESNFGPSTWTAIFKKLFAQAKHKRK